MSILLSFLSCILGLLFIPFQAEVSQGNILQANSGPQKLSLSSFLKGVSSDYGLVSKENYASLIDIPANYNCNMLRMFVYGAWADFNWRPWEGGPNDDMSKLRQDKINKLRDVISYANRKGIWVILSLFHDNGGGGTEDIISRDKSMLAGYINGIVKATADLSVIYETGNEILNEEFQRWVLNELKKYGVKTCSFYYSIGADFRSVHYGAEKREYAGGGIIHSTDKPSLIKLTDEDLKRIAEGAKNEGGHIEFLVRYKRFTGKVLDTYEEIVQEYGEILEYLKNL